MNDYQRKKDHLWQQYKAGQFTATQYLSKLDQLLQSIIDEIDSQTIAPLEIPAKPVP